ncbi:MAG: hypothetical protein H0Z18_03790 [Thermococcus sp.]|uniref:hypothetical protein n=1 Tax=Thermococcus sp. TaxID=35749 RepID=UPI001DAD4881|nr:hypothetical protein [Thermococcus sp.]MBO8174359.1 hypothetical protein [Thermococcus sp.]
MADVETAKLLIRIGSILAIIEPMIIAVILLMTIIGIIFAIPLMFLGYWIYKRSEEVITLIEEGRYKEAKDKLIVPMVVALILTSRLGGILMLIGLVILPSSNEQQITTL